MCTHTDKILVKTRNISVRLENIPVQTKYSSETGIYFGRFEIFWSIKKFFYKWNKIPVIINFNFCINKKDLYIMKNIFLILKFCSIKKKILRWLQFFLFSKFIFLLSIWIHTPIHTRIGNPPSYQNNSISEEVCLLKLLKQNLQRLMIMHQITLIWLWLWRRFIERRWQWWPRRFNPINGWFKFI